ncbi:MAG TPA: hypothetical protein VFQ80_01875 [Thermomicrobiales bacterium]|nr:hypothetical protein [Thermomicrobiales bacterium]
MRATLSCIIESTAFASGNTLGGPHSFTLYHAGQSEPSVARLRTHGGTGILLLRVALLFVVRHVPGDAERGPIEVATSFYQYKILNLNETEVVVYDYAPAGPSRVRRPHLHVPIAGSVVLAQPAGSSRTAMKTPVGKAHFPTGSIVLEDIVELLIRDFHVDPRRADWEQAIENNRRSIDGDA